METIICGDSLEIMKGMESDYIDLVVTSPPYAAQRAHTYGGIAPEKYIEWFLPISEQIKRILKPTGTFILNIKEHVNNGERHTYVIELVLALRKQNWLWTEEFIWHKKAAVPGKWPNRFRDAWEHIYQFNKQRKFNMYQDAVMVPAAPATIKRAYQNSKNDHKKVYSGTGSGFNIITKHFQGRNMVYPSNVLHISTEAGNVGHSAAFPKSLPSWFIKLFTQQDDMILDPFLGSGTTLVAAKELGRNAIGIDILQENCDLAQNRLNKTQVAQIELFQL